MSGASSFWVSFAKTLPFMLLCGIVGPIFLALYFLIDDPTAGWLLPWGLIITIGDVALAAAMAAANTGNARLSNWRTSAQLYGTFQPAPPVSPAPPAPALGTPAERLAELDQLMRKDLISTDEYAASRARILGEL
jgi:hypothetical protein